LVQSSTLGLGAIKVKPADKPWCTPRHWDLSSSVDGSFHACDRTAGSDSVLRDDLGNIFFTACRSFDRCASPLEAEIRACVEGQELTLQHSELPIIVESDCYQLIAATKHKSLDRSPPAHLVSELRFLSSHDRVLEIVYVERSQIGISHNLANLARVKLPSG
jgi:hypothetical protein